MVLTASRNRTATGTGILAAVILVLAFGNPAYVEWVPGNTTDTTAGGWFLRLLAWPSWRFSSDEPLRDLIAADLKAILLILLTAVLLAALVGSVAAGRGRASHLLAGWSAYVFAAATAGLLAAFIQTNPSLLGAFQSAAGGAIYGLFTGWVVGAAALSAQSDKG